MVHNTVPAEVVFYEGLYWSIFTTKYLSIECLNNSSRILQVIML